MGPQADMVDLHDYSSTDEFPQEVAHYGADLDRKRPEIFRGRMGGARGRIGSAVGCQRRARCRHALA